MVVTTAEFELLIVLADARANRGGIAKIKGSIIDRFQLSGRNQSGIDGCEFVRENLDLMVKNIAVAREIEVRMLREIKNGIFVCASFVFQSQSIVAHERISCNDGEIAGITFLAVFACIAQDELLAF